MRKSESQIISLIGKTPLVRLRRTELSLGLRVKLYAKLEMFNPSGSVKDRTALGIVRSAISEGRLYEGGTLVEATSGNMGISLSMLSNIFGYRAVILMPAGMSKERRGLIKAYGGEVVLTSGGMREAMERAEEISRRSGAFMPRQFTNINGMLAHLETGREIRDALGRVCDKSDCTAGGRNDNLDCTEGVRNDNSDCTAGGGGHSLYGCSAGQACLTGVSHNFHSTSLCDGTSGGGGHSCGVDIFVSGVGTGGTIGGAGRFLKEKNPKIRIVAVEPAESAVLSGKEGEVYGIERGARDIARRARDIARRDHGIEGIGAGFLPPLLDMSLIDEAVAVSTEEAKRACRLLVKYEGIFSGISSGAALFAAIKIAEKEENKDKTIVIILPDGGAKYLSKM